MKKLAIALALTRAARRRPMPTVCKATSAEKKLAGAAHDELHEEMRDATRRSPATRRRRKRSCNGAAKTSFTKKCVSDAVGT